MMLTIHFQFSANVKRGWSCASAPPVYLQGMNRDSFTFFTPLCALVVEAEEAHHLWCEIPEGLCTSCSNSFSTLCILR
jgi:hypothetical protein